MAHLPWKAFMYKVRRKHFLSVTKLKSKINFQNIVLILTDANCLLLRPSIPSLMTCLPSSSPCQHLTDWHVSEMMWCFSFTFTRDGTYRHTHTRDVAVLQAFFVGIPIYKVPFPVMLFIKQHFQTKWEP